MSEPATFDESEPLAKAAGVGQKSMDSLVAKGLAIEGEPWLHGRTFKITDKGWLALEWLSVGFFVLYPRVL